MAVVSPNATWPGSRVPYVADCKETEMWLLEVNHAIGYPLLVPKGRSDTDHIQAAQNGHGASETIGWVKSKGAHKISGSRRFVMQHELLHALGFHHEQLHAKGPWGAFGTQARSADRLDKDLLDQWGINMVPEESRIDTTTPKPAVSKDLDTLSSKKTSDSSDPRPRRNSITSGEVVKIAKNEEAIEQHKRAYQDALSDTNIVHLNACDFDSVMMYGEMTRAAESLKLRLVRTRKSTYAPELSNGDVAALKHLYPCMIVALVPAKV